MHYLGCFAGVHYLECSPPLIPGGLGEAVCSALSEEPNVCVRRLAVTGIPRSGPGSVLMDMFGISARHIVDAVKDIVKTKP